MLPLKWAVKSEQAGQPANVSTSWRRESGAGFGGGWILEGTSEAPPTSECIPGFVVRADSSSFGLETRPRSPERRVPRLDTCAPLPNLPSIPGSSNSPPRSSPSGGPAGPATPPGPTPLPARTPAYLFLLLVSCHCRWGRAGLRTPELQGRRGLQRSFAVAPSPLPRGRRCEEGARCSQVPSVRTVRWKLRAAGSVRGKGVENSDGEEPVPGGGVGKGVEGRCQTQKKWGERWAPSRAEVSFSFEKKSGVAFWVSKYKRLENDGSWQSPGPGRRGGYDHTVSGHCAEDCTAASRKAGAGGGGRRAVRRGTPECRAHGRSAHFKNSGGQRGAGRARGARAPRAGAGGGLARRRRGGAPPPSAPPRGRPRPARAARREEALGVGQSGGAAQPLCLTRPPRGPARLGRGRLAASALCG